MSPLLIAMTIPGAQYVLLVSKSVRWEIRLMLI